MATSRQLSDRVADFVISNIREEHPWMKIDVVRAAAEICKTTVEQSVKHQGPIVKQLRDRCSFMSLSPELRNRIYDLTLHPEEDGDGGIADCRAIRMNSYGCDSFYVTKWAKQPPITRLSRQIRAESLPMYYGGNTFVIFSEPQYLEEEGWGFDFGQAEPWLERIGPTIRSWIKRFEVCHYIPIKAISDEESAARFDYEYPDFLEVKKLVLPPMATTLAFLNPISDSDDMFWAPWDLDLRDEDADYVTLPPITPTSMRSRLAVMGPSGL